MLAKADLLAKDGVTGPTHQRRPSSSTQYTVLPSCELPPESLFLGVLKRAQSRLRSSSPKCFFLVLEAPASSSHGCADPAAEGQGVFGGSTISIAYWKRAGAKMCGECRNFRRRETHKKNPTLVGRAGRNQGLRRSVVTSQRSSQYQVPGAAFQRSSNPKADHVSGFPSEPTFHLLRAADNARGTQTNIVP